MPGDSGREPDEIKTAQGGCGWSAGWWLPSADGVFGSFPESSRTRNELLSLKWWIFLMPGDSRASLPAEVVCLRA